MFAHRLLQSTPMDEPALITAAKKGDLDSFNTLVLTYQHQVYNLAYRIMGDAAPASDATQEAFISAWRHIGGFRGGSFKAWLLRIVTNACYDELRRRKRRPTVPLEPVDSNEDELESPGWLADPGESPEESAVRSELDKAIRRCLEALPDEFRAMVVLVDLQGFDYYEAAEVVGSPVGTVKSRLSRARVRMKDCLKGFWELLPSAYRLVDEGL
jgi:RNA polymerase sigma-70 factor (ECF subfamily)